MVKNHEECKYYLPCGWCDKNNEKCIFEQVCEAPKKEEVTTPSIEYDFNKCPNKPCIEHEWVCTGADTGGWMYTCKKCYATKRENYQTFPSVNPLWINPNSPDINKVGDFPPYYDVTCINGVANTSEVTAQAFVNTVKSGELPEIPEEKENKK